MKALSGLSRVGYKESMMQYPLDEQIGKPELFVGRKKELKYFGQWIKGIPERLSKSQAILARKK